MTLYSHLLLAADFSEEQDDIGEQAVELASLFGARLSLFMSSTGVTKPPDRKSCRPFHPVPATPRLPRHRTSWIPAPVIAGTDQQLFDRALRFLDAFADQLGVPESEKIVVASSSVHKAIVETATRIGADLVVVGITDRHWLGLLMGSTSERLLRDGPCNVLAVRSRASSAAAPS